MSWFKCSGGTGMPSGLQEGMDSVLNKKFATSTTYPAEGWPDDVNLLGLLEEKTQASASVCSFSDGADDVPIKNWLVTLPASLDGYTAIHGRKNTGTGTPETQYTASLGRTIYGGTADIVNGTGKENCTNRNLVGDGFTWSYNTTELSFPYFTIGANAQNKASNKNFVCEGYVNNGNYRSNLQDGEIGVFNNTSGINRFCVRDDSCTTLEQFLEKNANTKITYEVTNPTDFTFDGQEVPTRLGYNAFWSDEGDTEVTYRSSGTVTPVLPTLISKTITENGTYSAEDDGADGYDEVTVNVSGGGTIIVDDLIEYPYPNNDNKCIYSSELNTQYAYYAFNPDCGNPYYWSGVGATNQYIGWKFDTAQIVNYYEIWTRNVGNQYDYLQAPKEWKLQGSNDDGITWIDLDAQDFTFTASGQKWASAVNNTTAYKWYRIYVITAQDTSNDTVIGYIDFKHAYIST